MLNIVMVFSYATLIFNLLSVKNIGTLYSNANKNFKLLFLMNIATLFNWLGSFLSLNYIDPATALCINLSMGPITTFFVLTPLRKIEENKHILFAIFFVLIGMLLIIKQQWNTSAYESTKHIYLGVLFSVLGGIAGGFVGICSERISKAGFSVKHILATRFYLLILVCGIALFFTTKGNVFSDIDWKFYLFSSLIIVMFPLVMYQTAIKALGSLIVSLFIPFAPIFAYFLQIMVGSYRFNFFTAILLLLVCCGVIWFARLRQRLAIAKNSSKEKL
ncbi:MAG: EamA/RhaT family transporter [Gammaproteobacteria bacterium]|nr:EamA/RhaT family transporter [Gammaproteobacteria bacterium]